MDFKTLFEILKKYLSDGTDIPYFFRELMDMITTVPENEWGTKTDPSGILRDETIRNYTKRKLSRAFARKIVCRLTPDIFKERIDELDVSVRTQMAKDLCCYDSSINAENVSEKVADMLVECITTDAGLISKTELERKKCEITAAALKSQYGEYLLTETMGVCPNCGKELSESKSGKILFVYEVTAIDEEKKIEPNNLIAMCPSCHATYQLDSKNKKVSRQLRCTKKIISTHRQNMILLDSLPLDKGITDVITKIQNLNEKDLENVTFDPKNLTDKINPEVDYILYKSVRDYVTTYFLKIREIMISLDKRGIIHYLEVQRQMSNIYERLQKESKSQREIFNEISEKIHRVTLQEDIYCAIVVSYFIQSCEVF